MRIPVTIETDDLEDLAQAREEMQDTAHWLGWVPRFLVAEEWRYRGQFAEVKPFMANRGQPVAEHMGKLKAPRERRP